MKNIIIAFITLTIFSACGTMGKCPFSSDSSKSCESCSNNKKESCQCSSCSKANDSSEKKSCH